MFGCLERLTRRFLEFEIEVKHGRDAGSCNRSGNNAVPSAGRRCSHSNTVCAGIEDQKGVCRPGKHVGHHAGKSICPVWDLLFMSLIGVSVYMFSSLWKGFNAGVETEQGLLR